MAVAGPSRDIYAPYDEVTINFVPLFSIANALACATDLAPSWLAPAFDARRHLFTPESFPKYSKPLSPQKVSLANKFDLKGVSESEQKLVDQTAKHLEIDSIEALVLLRSWRILQRGASNWQSVEDDDDVDESWWLRLTEFYFEERSTTLRIIREVIELADDPVAPQSVQDFCSQQTKALQPSAEILIEKFRSQTKQTCPDSARSSRSLVQQWAKQTLREETQLLELLFSIWYSRSTPTGNDIQNLLECIKATEWGNKQAAAPYWDAKAKHHASVVACLLVTLSVEVWSIEEIAVDDSVFGLPLSNHSLPESEDLLFPERLLVMHNLVIELSESYLDLSAPLAFSWSYVLSKLTHSDGMDEVHPDYAGFIEVTQADFHNPQPMWQRLLTHSFDRVFAMLSSGLSLLSSLSNTTAILSILRLPIGIIPQMVRLAFLPDDSVAALTDFAVRVFGHEAALPLRAQLWGLYDQGQASTIVTGERDLLDFHARRFPFKAAPLLKLLVALSGSGASEDMACTERASDYLANLPYAATLIPNSRNLPATAYDISNSDPTLYTIVSQNGMAISPGVSLSSGVQGRLVSISASSTSIVQWDLTESGWNGWRWIQDLLEAYAAPAQNSKAVVIRDPFAADGIKRPLDLSSMELLPQVIGSALDLWSKDLVSLTSRTLAVDDQDVPMQTARMAFAVLERAVREGDLILCQTAIQFLTALLPSAPGAVWSLLRAGRGHIFDTDQGGRSIKSKPTLLRQSKQSGGLIAIQALVDFVYALQLETQRSSGAAAHLDAKGQVLSAALTWVYQHLWEADIFHWPCANEATKWSVCSATASLYAAAIYDSTMANGGNLGAASKEAVRFFASTSDSSAPRGVISLCEAMHVCFENLLALIPSEKEQESAACEKAYQACLWLMVQILLKTGSLAKWPHSTFLSPSPNRSKSSAALLMSTILFHSAFSLQTSVLACQILALLAASSVEERDQSATGRFLTIFEDPAQQSGAVVSIASDEHIDIELRIALWEMINTFVANQPALTIVFINGTLRAHSDDAVSTSPLVKALTEAVSSAGLSTVPQLAVAILSTVLAVLQRSIDFPEALEYLQITNSLWTNIIEIALEPLDDVSAMEDIGRHCHYILAQSQAFSILACELELPDTVVKKDAIDSIKTALVVKVALASLTLRSAHNDANSVLHHSLLTAFGVDVPQMDMASCRKQAPHQNRSFNILRDFGLAYNYDTTILVAKLSALVGTVELEHLLHLTEAVNCNWSLIDAQITRLRVWNQLVGRMSERFGSQTLKTLAAATNLLILCSEQKQSGDILIAIYRERLTTAHSLLAIAAQSTNNTAEEASALLFAVQNLVNHPIYNSQASIRGEGVPFHSALAQVAHSTLDILFGSKNVSAEGQQMSQNNKGLETILRFAVAAMTQTLAHPAATLQEEDRQTISTCSYIILTVIRHQASPRPSTWLTFMREEGFFLLAASSLAQIGSDSDARGFCCIEILLVLIGIADCPQGAEAIAVEHLPQVLINSGLAAAAEQASLAVDANQGQSTANTQHRLWCLTTTLMNRLLVSLRNSTAFVAEIGGFVHLVLPQIRRTLAWEATSSELTSQTMDELESLTGVTSLALSQPALAPVSLQLLEPVLMFTCAAVYAVQHPNTLASSLQPLYAEEEKWVRQPESVPPTATDAIDFVGRPVAGALVQSFLGMLCHIVDGFNAYGRSFDILKSDMLQWPYERCCIHLSVKASRGEPASVGTFIELASYCVDILRHHKKDASDSNSSTPMLAAYSPSICRAYAAHLLEASLLLVVSQIALAWHNPRSSSQQSQIRAQRLIRNEIQPDISALIHKAGSLELRAGSVKSPQGKSRRDDVLGILQKFASLYLQ